MGDGNGTFVAAVVDNAPAREEYGLPFQERSQNFRDTVMAETASAGELGTAASIVITPTT
ncbi:hypothetical protein [Nocardia aurantiaca]|uniref:Uncharacterized protein n=1 Tax=Nocardia aurantiaca TaxID=2675850 RepID=A0A6I3L6W3_9NOCA|nr:hypothetical protein [Nocardia aurantiaca]MTE16424.1 hypothetical protein [Nocardia aurantiaca]